MSSRKPRVFIGSSREGLAAAKALHACWHHCLDFTADLWCDAGFALSETTVEALERIVADYDFGVFLFSPDDQLTIRDQTLKAVRDNVLFELGLFLGRHGRNRCFLVQPRNTPIRMPTDLSGVTVADYDPSQLENSAGDPQRALRVAAERIARGVRAQPARDDKVQVSTFSSLTPLYGDLFERSTNVTTCFIHSRRWRENCLGFISTFLDRSDTSLSVYLPDPRVPGLIHDLMTHFDDGRVIPALVDDAYRYFFGLAAAHPARVNVQAFQLYPTYSFYRFDHATIVALYPTTSLKMDVPAFLALRGTRPWSFVESDMAELARTAKPIKVGDLPTPHSASGRHV